MKIRNNIAAVAAMATVSAMALAGCSSSTGSVTAADEAPDHLEGTVSLWHFFDDREADVIQSVVDDFEEANPDVTVEVHSGQDDEKVTKAIAAGKDVDVAISYSTDIVGTFCSSGAFIDLAPFIERDDVDPDNITDMPRSYTEYDGTRCALPALADVFGLYYNKDILAEHGYDSPPTTLSELEDMALEMTEYNDDGSIKTLGYNPLMGWGENAAAHIGPVAGAKWLNDDNTSAIGSSDGWAELMQWQHDFVNEIGYDELKAFSAGLGQEFSADNPFQTGQVAMNLDGEWRTAFIADQAPDLNYGAAPLPAADDHSDLYGGGYITGNIAGIGKGTKNPELAWALLKYLTTDTDAVVKAANGLGNVPTTKAALESADLDLPDQFDAFLEIMDNPNSDTTPPSPVGSGYQKTFDDFWNEYQSGDGSGLEDGLAQVDDEIDDQIALTTGP